MAQTILNACCLGHHRFYFSSTSRKSRRSHGSSLSASKEPGPQGPRPAKQGPKLKRFKDDVKEVGTNFECGISLTNCNDIKVGDIIESYEEIEVKQTL